MQAIVSYLINARLWLEAIDPRLSSVALILILWVPQYAVRRFLPRAWEYMASLPGLPANVQGIGRLARKAWQALPSAGVAALLGWMSTKDGTAWDAVSAAMVGVGAPLWHEVLKLLPKVPYKGGTATALAFCLPLMLSGCVGTPTPRNIVLTVNDVARSLCVMYFGPQMGISLAELKDKAEAVAEKACSTRKQLEPFVLQVLGSQKSIARSGLPAPAP